MNELCPACGDPIEADDGRVVIDDGARGVLTLHVDCADDSDEW